MKSKKTIETSNKPVYRGNCRCAIIGFLVTCPGFTGCRKTKDAIICQRLALQDITTYDTILMLKKIIKYTLRALLVVLVVLILVPALLYIPAVQDFVRKRAVGYASRALGMDLSVERLRLSFPLRLSVDNTLLVDKADTLLSCGRLSLDVALWPLVRKEVVIRSFGLERVAARYKDSLAGMDMRLSAGLLSLDAAKADLSANTAGITSLVLSDADVRLDITQAAPKEEADTTAALPWTIGIGKLSVGNLAFGMRTAPAVSELSVRLAEGTVDECRVRLDSQQVSVKSVLLNRGGYSYLTGPAVPGKEKQEAAPAPGGSTPVASVDGSHRQRRADRQSGGIRAAEPSSRSGIRPVVHRPPRRST